MRSLSRAGKEKEGGRRSYKDEELPASEQRDGLVNVTWERNCNYNRVLALKFGKYKKCGRALGKDCEENALGQKVSG
jgi:hypothetical protein